MKTNLNGQVGRYLYEATCKNRIKLAVLTVLQVALSLANIGFVLTMSAALDSAVAGASHTLRRELVYLMLWVLLRLGMRALLRYLEESASAAVENTLKGRLFSHLLHGDFARVKAVHTGEWMNRLTSDTTVVAGALTGILPNLLGMLVKLTGAAVMLLYMIPQAAVFLVPGGLVAMAVAWALRRNMKKHHKAVQEADGSLRSFLQERMGSLMVLRAFRTEAASGEEAAAHMLQHMQARLKKRNLSNLCNTAFAALMNGIYILGFAYCGYGLMRGELSYGTLLAVIQLVGQIQTPFAGLSGVLPQYYAMLASAERLLEAEAFPQEPHSEEAALPDYAGFRLQDVCFAYPDEPQTPVLKNACLDIRKGDFIALTGTSGTGKSTLFKLLLQLYQPESGSVGLVCGDGSQVPLQIAHRTLFAYVPQGSPLMCGSVRRIVSFSDDPQFDPQIWDALRIACADSFVSELEQGLDSPLGEQGAGLSEGQLQRLSLARAIFSGAPVLLLDEATSALDAQTELQVLHNLAALADKTILLVTHRPAALDHCSRRVHLTESGALEADTV